MSKFAKCWFGVLAAVLAGLVGAVFITSGIEAGGVVAVIAAAYMAVVYARMNIPAEVWEEMARKHSRFY